MQAQVLTVTCHKSSILPQFFSKKFAYSGNLSATRALYKDLLPKTHGNDCNFYAVN